MNLMSKSELQLALRNISRSVVVTHQRIQHLAVQACLYSRYQKDATVANQLLEAVGINKSIRRDSLVKYLEVYGYLAFRKEAKTFEHFTNERHDELKKSEYVALISSRNWDEAKKDVELKSVYDMGEIVRTFLAKTEKMMGDEEIAKRITNPEAFQLVRNAFNKWSATEILKTTKADVTEADKADDRAAVVADGYAAELGLGQLRVAA